MLVMIDNYDSFTFNIVQYFKELNQEIIVFRNDQITVREIYEYSPDALIISPGPCTPDKAGISNDVVKAAIKNSTPLLGICLGFQCIGEVLGAKITYAPNIMHGKTSKIYHTREGIFNNIPSPFEAVRYHSLALDTHTIPKRLKITAETEDNIVMAIQHTNLPIHGVQFHPESALSEYGHQILQNFLHSP